MQILSHEKYVETVRLKIHSSLTSIRFENAGKIRAFYMYMGFWCYAYTKPSCLRNTFNNQIGIKCDCFTTTIKNYRWKLCLKDLSSFYGFNGLLFLRFLVPSGLHLQRLLASNNTASSHKNGRILATNRS